MSIIENLRSRPKSPQPPPNHVADVAARLKIADAELADLEARYGQAALDALMGNGDLGPLSRQLNAARDQVSTLRAAHSAALVREQEEIQRQRAALQKTQLNAVKRHLASRDAAAKTLEIKIEEAAKQFHILLDESAAARRACPVGFSWPSGDLCGDSELIGLVANSLYRESVTPSMPNDGRAFPAPAPDHISHVHNPKGIEALDKRISDASTYVLGKLTGKAPG